MIVLSQRNKNKNTVSDVKKLQKMFWDDADITAATEIQIITSDEYAKKYMGDIKKLAEEKGYEVAVIEAAQQ